MSDTLTIALALSGAILVGTVVSLVIIAAVTRICYPPKDEEAANKTDSNERSSRLGKVATTDDDIAFIEESYAPDGSGQTDLNSQTTTETNDNYAASSSPV